MLSRPSASKNDEDDGEKWNKTLSDVARGARKGFRMRHRGRAKEKTIREKNVISRVLEYIFIKRYFLRDNQAGSLRTLYELFSETKNVEDKTEEVLLGREKRAGGVKVNGCLAWYWEVGWWDFKGWSWWKRYINAYRDFWCFLFKLLL